MGTSQAFFKFLLFTCSQSSIPTPQYDFEYKVYDAFGIAIHSDLYSVTTSDELRILPYDPNTEAFLRFNIQVIEQTKPVPYSQMFGPFSLNMTCENSRINATVSSSLDAKNQTNLTLTQDDFTTREGWYEVQFYNFTTSLAKCHIYGYYLSNSTEEFLNHTELAVPNVTSEGFTVSINTKKVRHFNFSIFANDSSGNQNQTQEVKIYIEPPPPDPIVEFDPDALVWKP